MSHYDMATEVPMRWLRIIAPSILGCVVLITAAGFIYEQIGRARDARLSSTRIGKAYSVNGHSLNLYCSGSGSRTVVFESGGNALGIHGCPCSTKWRSSPAPAGMTALV